MFVSREIERKTIFEGQRKVRKFIQEMKEENPGWVKERQLEYLNFRLDSISCLQKKAHYNNSPFWLRQLIWDYGEGDKLLKKKKFLEKPVNNGLTDEMIEQAKEYPISELLEVDRAGFALCPYHNDTRPSLYTKNGFGYCFVCGKSASPISLYMKISGAGFVEAVKFLAGG